MEARRRKEEEERRKQDEIDRKNAVSIRHLICIILRFFSTRRICTMQAQRVV